MWTDELHSHCRISKNEQIFPMRNEYVGNEKIINHKLNDAYFNVHVGRIMYKEIGRRHFSWLQLHVRHSQQKIIKPTNVYPSTCSSIEV